MTAETRVGIVAGLVIVVAASVYFFYGSDKDDDRILVSAPTRVSVPPKIPTAADLKNHSIDKKAGPQRVVRAPGRPVTGPLANNSAQRRLPTRITQPPAPATPPRVEAAPVVKQPDAPVALRTGPSPELVEATRDNLVKKDKPIGDEGKQKTAVIPDSPTTAQPNTASPPIKPIESAPRGSPLLVTNNPSVAPPKASASAAPHPSTEWPKKHTIAPGDTLSKIARQYYDDGTRKDAILAANPQIKNERQLRIGDVLTLPAPNGPSGAAPSRVADAKPIARSSTSETSTNSHTSGRTYKVQKGDTLYSIAKKQCGSSSRWEEIVRLNKDVLKGNPSRLSNGMILKLPENTAPTSSR